MGAENQIPIQVRDLHKSFGTQTVLDGIGLEVRQGETLAVVPAFHNRGFVVFWSTMQKPAVLTDGPWIESRPCSSIYIG